MQEVRVAIWVTFRYIGGYADFK